MNSFDMWTIYAWIGWAVVTLLLGVMYWVTALLAGDVYKRLCRTYHLTVIRYWLDRFEKEGLRTFQRPD